MCGPIAAVPSGDSLLPAGWTRNETARSVGHAPGGVRPAGLSVQLPLCLRLVAALQALGLERSPTTDAFHALRRCAGQESCSKALDGGTEDAAFATGHAAWRRPRRLPLRTRQSASGGRGTRVAPRPGLRPPGGARPARCGRGAGLGQVCIERKPYCCPGGALPAASTRRHNPAVQAIPAELVGRLMRDRSFMGTRQARLGSA